MAILFGLICKYDDWGQRHDWGSELYYQHAVNLKHSWHFPFLTDQQPIDDSSPFVCAAAEQSSLETELKSKECFD
jgi:hypothetical protein